jgi:SAM-dependent methyltransferase
MPSGSPDGLAADPGGSRLRRSDMREHLDAFIQSVSEAFPLAGPVYEFGYGPGVDSQSGTTPQAGSLDGACFAFREPGPGEIERLEDLVRLPFPDGAARTIVAIHALEHVFEPRRAVEEMIRILAPGGLLVLCSQSGAGSPESVDRYWQPTPRAMQRLLAGLEATLIGWQGDDQDPHTLFGIAAKPPGGETFFVGAGRFLDGFQKRLNEAAEPFGWRQRLKHRLAAWRRSFQQVLAQVPPRGRPRSGPRAAKRNGVSARYLRNFHKAQFVLDLPVPEQLKHQLLASCLPEEETGPRLDTTR